ncbi:MAG: hypothetical protein CK426_02265 [Legionella sp.]|nr:MAG: hypothetical protein CK423_00595 [Legionella sp.]PJD99626.1 MAG: hypothetical protein CK426_02265 [Legionella sp.]
MNSKLFFGLLSCSASLGAMADQSIYCPQNHGYINLGMTTNQVIAACGQPLSQQNSNQPIYQQVPVQQLIYSNQGSRSSFYGVWNLQTGYSGTSLQVDILDNKVKAIRLNGSSNNAFSICNGVNIQIGDPVGKVYGACGTPSVTNNTFTNIPVPLTQKPIIWTYQPSPYQSTVTLTFVNGQLQSINN